MNKKISVVALTLIFLLLNSCGDKEAAIQKRAAKIHESVLTVDSHCDTPMRLLREDFDPGVKNESGCIDFPRMKEGGLDAEFFAVFIGQGPRDDSTNALIHQRAIDIFDAIHKSVEKNSDQAEIALVPADAYRIEAEGKRAIFIGIENGYPIGKDIANVEEFYKLGARYITLCHSRNNDICDSSTDPNGPEHDGLSDFGAEVVKEMNRLGIMVDVSHISDKSFYDVLKTTSAPVIASHSSCRALCESPRNLDDKMIHALKDNGGVIQICILSDYLRQPEPNPELDQKLQEIRDKYNNFRDLKGDTLEMARREYYETREKYKVYATIADAVDHIDHVVQLVGVDHVGIGTDFDGGGGIKDLMDVSQMENLTVEMVRRGYTKKDIEKIWGGNIMRVMAEVQRIAAENAQQTKD